MTTRTSRSPASHPFLNVFVAKLASGVFFFSPDMSLLRQTKMELNKNLSTYAQKTFPTSSLRGSIFGCFSAQCGFLLLKTRWKSTLTSHPFLNVFVAKLASGCIFHQIWVLLRVTKMELNRRKSMNDKNHKTCAKNHRNRCLMHSKH